MWEGLGVVIIFGIAFATLLTLVVVPVMYTLFDGLGYHINSAMRGTRWLEPPTGQSYYLSRRRWAGSKLAVLLLIQGAILAYGFYKLSPWFIEQYRNEVLQASSLLRLVLESAVFYLTLAIEAGGLLLVLLIPFWAGLIYFKWLKNNEDYYMEIAPDGLVLTSPIEKLFVPADEIKKVRYSHIIGRLVVNAGPRIIKIRDVIEREGPASNISLWRWLGSSPPRHRQLTEGRKSLRLALERLMAKSRE